MVESTSFVDVLVVGELTTSVVEPPLVCTTTVLPVIVDSTVLVFVTGIVVVLQTLLVE